MCIRDSSTISRELNRNRVAGPYQPQEAGLLAAARSQRSAANARRVPAAAWEFAVEKLAETWSPQQIAGHQRAECLLRLDVYKRQEMRIELYDKVNRLGIGAQGLGGLTTVLDVKVLDTPCHAANLPVAMIPNCACLLYTSRCV